MALKDSWKKTGKSIGGAFANFGKAMGTTAKVVFTDEKNDVDENGESKLKKAWKKTGKGFGEAGKNFGTSMGDTAKNVVGKDKEKKETSTSTEGAVDAEFSEVDKKQIEEKKEN